MWRKVGHFIKRNPLGFISIIMMLISLPAIPVNLGRWATWVNKVQRMIAELIRLTNEDIRWGIFGIAFLTYIISMSKTLINELMLKLGILSKPEIDLKELSSDCYNLSMLIFAFLKDAKAEITPQRIAKMESTFDKKFSQELDNICSRLEKRKLKNMQFDSLCRSHETFIEKARIAEMLRLFSKNLAKTKGTKARASQSNC